MRQLTIFAILGLIGTAHANETSPVRGLLVLAIERGAPLFNNGSPEACAAVYEVAARAILDLGGDVLVDDDRRMLRSALEGDHDHRARAWALRRAMDQVLERTRTQPKAEFEPIMEAPLPDGFPQPGPLDKVILKRYPTYRAARVDGGMRSFWTLFNHIKKNDIAMTAPVEMNMNEVRGGSALSLRDMSFLYAQPGLGATGKQGEVSVVDLEPAMVLSVGLRGPMTQPRIAEAKSRIELELKLQSGSLERAGGWRLLGYNSPRIPAANQFHEIQVRVRERAKTAASH